MSHKGSPTSLSWHAQLYEVLDHEIQENFWSMLINCNRKGVSETKKIIHFKNQPKFTMIPNRKNLPFTLETEDSSTSLRGDFLAVPGLST